MPLDLDHVQYDIERWIANFVEVPHPSLGGWAPCPYARKARLERDFEVRVGINPYFDLKTLASTGIKKNVVILVYASNEFTAEQLAVHTASANTEFLLNKDLIALDDHPNELEIVNSVRMNQGSYALVLVQPLADLNDKATLLAKQGFYDNWPEEYLQVLFKNRKDPRA